MAFLAVGVYPRQLAVISGYRSQLRLANQYFRGVEGLEVATIDKYQGRDKDCVLISLVRSNTENNANLLKDWKRINVAFSRAKAKLIIVGSRSTLESSMMFKKLFDLLTKNNQVSFLSLSLSFCHFNCIL
ncbi:AAA domain-containing protein [Spinellus fusiger]|nr:AAA domain-containing protein [Spinellus fusiger]